METFMKVKERLDKLKGFLLLREDGTPYFLKGYDIETKCVRGWLTKRQDYTYISKIETTIGDVHTFDYHQTSKLVKVANDLIEDRKRYINMLKQFSSMGYTIKRK